LDRSGIVRKGRSWVRMDWDWIERVFDIGGIGVRYPYATEGL
jgi:hypothetical protein